MTFTSLIACVIGFTIGMKYSHTCATQSSSTISYLYKLYIGLQGLLEIYGRSRTVELVDRQRQNLYNMLHICFVATRNGNKHHVRPITDRAARAISCQPIPTET